MAEERQSRDELQGRATQSQLQDAFLREAATGHRYLYFAIIAEIEGSPAAAQLFRDLAASCVCNAHGTLDFLKRVGDPLTDLPIGETEGNLQAAISAETHEFTELYPTMEGTARVEGFQDIGSWLETLGKLKRVHAGQLRQALADFHRGAGEDRA